MDLISLKVILEDRIEKLTLSSGIPSTVELLHESVKETVRVLSLQSSVIHGFVTEP